MNPAKILGGCAILIVVAVLLAPATVGAQAISGEALDEDESYLEDPFAEKEYEEGPTIPDPIAPWNRAMFHFNDKFYFWVLKPVSQGYGKVVPEFGRLRVRDFFNNLTAPIRIVNSILQLKFEAAGLQTFRFLANSTAGLGGLFDLAQGNPDFKAGEEDLGQTLGFYGVNDGFYIVWPFLGPSSLRDSIGRFGDGFLYPVDYLSDTGAIIGTRAYETVNDTSLRIGDYEDFKESALDPYTSLRDAYIQHRTDKINR